jgi:predicted metal-dependent phosphoesterase TrpH
MIFSHRWYIQGVEVSALFGEHLFRFLAYDFDINNQSFQELLSSNRAVWDDIGRDVVEVYAKHYSKASADAYDRFTPQAGLGGFKHNQYMGSLGYDNTFNADMKFFKKHPEEASKIKGAYAFKSIFEVVPILHEAGAKVVVSAEYFRDTKTFDAIVDQAIALGIDGFECYRNLDKNLEDTMATYAQSKNMLITGGGNGHGNWTDPERYNIGNAHIQSKDLNLSDMSIIN